MDTKSLTQLSAHLLGTKPIEATAAADLSAAHEAVRRALAGQPTGPVVPIHRPPIDTVALIQVVRDPGTTPILIIPLSGPVAGGTSYTLAQGSVWISAPLLNSSAPAGSYTGLRIKGGTLTLDTASTVPVGVAPPVIHITATATATLTIQTDPPAAPPPGGGIGADGTHAQATLPPSATFQFNSSGGTITAAAPASCQIYGSHADLAQWNGQASYSPPLSQLLVPYQVKQTSFKVSEQHSNLFIPSGSAPIVFGVWALQVITVGDPTTLGDAGGDGQVGVVVSAGMSATWKGLQGTVLPAFDAILEAGPGYIEAAFLLYNRRASQSIALWREGKGPTRSSIEIDYDQPFLGIFAATASLEIMAVQGTAVGHLDRPLAADGGRLALRFPQAVLLELLKASGRQAQVTGQVDARVGCTPLALQNALLICTPAGRLSLSGQIDDNEAINAGSLSLLFGLRGLQPILPDPYAANVGPVGNGDGLLGTATANVTWPKPEQPQLDIPLSLIGDTARITELLPGHPSAAPTHAPLPVAPGIVAAHPVALAAPHPEALAAPVVALTHLPTDVVYPPDVILHNAFVQLAGGQMETWRLLDVSTNSDLLGVAVGLSAPPSGMAVQSLALSAPAQNLRLMTLPGVSWEPVLTIKGPPTPPPPIPPEPPLPNPYTFPNDGDANLLGVNSVTLVPMAPQPIYDNIVAAVQAGTQGAAFFTLPFGMWAVAGLQPPTATTPGTLVFNVRPGFPTQGLTGGRQIRLLAAGVPGADESPVMPGAAVQLVDGSGQSVLGTVATIFNSDFFSPGNPPPHGPRVPVTRIDLSGYGESTTSLWTHNVGDADEVAIIKAQFDVYVGRTAYEQVKAQSILYPWIVPVVRTITIYRDGGGSILREDTGWVAAGPAKFELSGDPYHKGAVTGLINVRNIAESTPHYTAPGIDLVPVTFDADVQFQGLSGVVPSKTMFGYVQLTPALPLAAVDFATLLGTVGPLGGPVNAQLDVGGSGQKMRLARVEVDAAIDPGTGNYHFVVVTRGAPVLPKEGAWSVARKSAGAPAPTPLDTNFTVPLIKQLGSGTPWRFADAGDLLRGSNPLSDYGLLQGTGTQKMFVQQPIIAEGAKAITTALNPVMADVSKLLASSGIFPDLGGLFNLVDDVTKFALNVLPGGLQFGGVADPSGTYSKQVPAGTTVDLLNLGFIRVYIDFSSSDGSTPTTLTARLSPGGWAIAFNPFSFVLDIGSFTGIIRVTGSARASSSGKPSFGGPISGDPLTGTAGNPVIKFGGALDALTQILQTLKDLAAKLGITLPGIDVSFSNGKLTVVDEFPLPDLPLGLGTISGVTLRLGAALTLPDHVDFVVGIDKPDNPFKWVVTPLAGNGCVQLAAKDNNHDIVVKGGLGLGFAIDVGIAKGSASITVSAELDVGTADIAIKGTLTGQAEVDVLGGLASASLTLSATLGLQFDFPSGGHPNGQVELFADVSVGIHISICWVINIDFDGSWQFSRAFDVSV